MKYRCSFQAEDGQGQATYDRTNMHLEVEVETYDGDIEKYAYYRVVDHEEAETLIRKASGSLEGFIWDIG